LGHANPELTLRTYAHVMPEEESDVSFADFGGSKRLYPAPGDLSNDPNENTLERIRSHSAPSGDGARGDDTRAAC
jgi:hypothetical protein